MGSQRAWTNRFQPGGPEGGSLLAVAYPCESRDNTGLSLARRLIRTLAETWLRLDFKEKQKEGEKQPAGHSSFAPQPHPPGPCCPPAPGKTRP